MVKALAFLVKPLLNIVAALLKLSRHNIYYLVSGPLRKEIEAERAKVFMYEHIDSAVFLAKKGKKVSNPYILDVGGGTAATAKLFNNYFPNTPIIIFEPIKANFETIENAKERTPFWTILNKAAGSNIGKSEINIAHRITASSLLELDAENSNGYQETLQFQRKESIEITTLDHEIPTYAYVEVLKLDVQGFELEVLKGAVQTLPRVKIVVLEINNHNGFKGAPTYYELDAFFRANQFELYDLFPTQRENGKLLDWDAVYVNKNYLT
jgi:FkbM family methyltransferase